MFHDAYRSTRREETTLNPIQFMAETRMTRRYERLPHSHTSSYGAYGYCVHCGKTYAEHGGGGAR